MRLALAFSVVKSAMLSCRLRSVTILSGTERGVTLGTPIALTVPNEDMRPSDYAEMSNIPRPGHADYTYQVCRPVCPAAALVLMR